MVDFFALNTTQEGFCVRGNVGISLAICLIHSSSEGSRSPDPSAVRQFSEALFGAAQILKNAPKQFHQELASCSVRLSHFAV